MNVKGFLIKNRSTLAWVFVLLAFRWSFADQYRVPTGSMLPTIQLGDHVLTNKMAYDFRLPFTDLKLRRTAEPRRGDVIVFRYPKDESINFIKRVIGLPGETIKIENNRVYINDRLLDETYLPESAKRIIYEHQFEIKIPDDQYFVMGDNRSNSLDSRYWGFVPRQNIKGKALGVLWNVSFDNFIPQIDIFRTGTSI